jgi:EAL domain-containing protein (putative c-di-GMP-specific phosphodiesterase class I)
MIELVQRLRASLRSDDFELHYQPILDRKRRLAGAEALIRWRDPGAVGPSVFIPVTERSGLIIPLSNWVLDQAMTDQMRMREQGVEIGISINLSPRQLRTGHLYDQIVTRITATHLPPALMRIELTESSFATNIEIVSQTLRRLRSLGIGVSVDDFGTGYSNLSYLKHLPIDRIKIDRGFVAGIPSSPTDEALVQAIVSLAHTFGHAVVAEGVKTEEQFEYLKRIDVDYFQGYFFAMAMPLDEFVVAADRWQG